MAVYPQLLSPSPPIVADASDALLHAVDRQQLVDTLQGGLGGAARSVQIPDAPEYKTSTLSW